MPITAYRPSARTAGIEFKRSAEKPINAFEALTLAPIDRRLIDQNMLAEHELSWLNDYHARVRREVRANVNEATKVWLDAATAPLQ